MKVIMKFIMRIFKKSLKRNVLPNIVFVRPTLTRIHLLLNLVEIELICDSEQTEVTIWFNGEVIYQDGKQWNN